MYQYTYVNKDTLKYSIVHLKELFKQVMSHSFDKLGFPL